MSESDVGTLVVLAMVLFFGLVGVAWMHWYTRDARPLEREIRERRNPAE